MEYNKLGVANNIKDLIYQINNDSSRTEVYRKYLFQFHDEWRKKDKIIDNVSYGKYIWGSKVVTSQRKIEDVFNDNLLVQIVSFFNGKGKYHISEINEDDLFQLLFYPNVGYIKYNMVLNILFVEESKDKQKKSEAIEGMKDINEVLINEVNTNLNENLINEIIDFTESLKEQLNYGNDLILKIQSEYVGIKSQLLEKEEENKSLKIEIAENKEIKERKDEEIQYLQYLISEMKKEREEDRKILSEFKNMKEIMDTIKGLFAKDVSF